MQLCVLVRCIALLVFSSISVAGVAGAAECCPAEKLYQNVGTLYEDCAERLAAGCCNGEQVSQWTSRCAGALADVVKLAVVPHKVHESFAAPTVSCSPLPPCEMTAAKQFLVTIKTNCGSDKGRASEFLVVTTAARPAQLVVAGVNGEQMSLQVEVEEVGQPSTSTCTEVLPNPPLPTHTAASSRACSAETSSGPAEGCNAACSLKLCTTSSGDCISCPGLCPGKDYVRCGEGTDACPPEPAVVAYESALGVEDTELPADSWLTMGEVAGCATEECSAATDRCAAASSSTCCEEVACPEAKYDRIWHRATVGTPRMIFEVEPPAGDGVLPPPVQFPHPVVAAPAPMHVDAMPHFSSQARYEDHYQKKIAELLSFIPEAKVAVQVEVNQHVHQMHRSVRLGQPAVLESRAMTYDRQGKIAGLNLQDGQQHDEQRHVFPHEETVEIRAPFAILRARAVVAIPMSYVRQIYLSCTHSADPSAVNDAREEVTRMVESMVVTLLPQVLTGTDPYPMVMVSVYEDELAEPEQPHEDIAGFPVPPVAPAAVATSVPTRPDPAGEQSTAMSRPLDRLLRIVIGVWVVGAMAMLGSVAYLNWRRSVETRRALLPHASSGTASLGSRTRAA